MDDAAAAAGIRTVERTRALDWLAENLVAIAPGAQAARRDPGASLSELGLTSLETFVFLVGLAPDLGFEWTDDVDSAVFHSLDSILDYVAPRATDLHAVLSTWEATRGGSARRG